MSSTRYRKLERFGNCNFSFSVILGIDQGRENVTTFFPCRDSDRSTTKDVPIKKCIHANIPKLATIFITNLSTVWYYLLRTKLILSESKPAHTLFTFFFRWPTKSFEWAKVLCGRFISFWHFGFCSLLEGFH